MKMLYIWLCDYWHLLKRGIVMFIYLKPHKHYLGHRVKSKRPIIILPGILGRWSFMRPIANPLSLDGHPVYIVSKLKNNLFNIPLSASIVEKFIVENEIDDAVIVAHSKGGLIGKYFMEYHNKEGRVKGMIALASPFSGSAMAKLIPHKAFLELLPDSIVIKRLNDNKKVNKKIISISPLYDNHVWAEEGSYLKGALDNIKVNVSGHHKIISNKKVLEIVKHSLLRF